MSRTWQPADPDALADLVAARLHESADAAAATTDRVAFRVAVDGPGCAEPLSFAQAIATTLRGLGHEAPVISTDTFWRDASLRFEYGHEDALALRSWLDTGALRREVLDPLGPGGSGSYLPSLRNPRTNRSSREPYRRAAPGTVLLVAGEFLLDDGLPFDVRIHLRLSPAARARRTTHDLQWTLPAHVDYDRTACPVERADIVVKLDDPWHPAVSLR